MLELEAPCGLLAERCLRKLYVKKLSPFYFAHKYKNVGGFYGQRQSKSSRIELIFLAVGLIFGWPVFALAATVSLPQTGQAICYDSDGVVVTCSGTGQDGDTRAGLPLPNPRYTNNGNGTITDNLTGLIWDQEAGITAHWQEALDLVKSRNQALYKGAGDWRLPNVNELESIYLAAGVGVSYWTSTKSLALGDNNTVWAVAPGYGTYYDSETNWANIWTVRGKTRGPAQVRKTGVSTCYDSAGAIIDCAGTGQDGELQEGVPLPVDRFTIIYGDVNGLCPDQNSDCDGNPSTDAVLDKLTNRMWFRDANKFGEITWQGALTAVQTTLNSGGGFCGYTDWRVPNEKEAFSLFDYSQIGPALPLGHPFVFSQNIYNYWTSTTYPAQYNAATIILPWHGAVTGELKIHSSNNFLWPVRTANVGPDLHALLSAPANPVPTGDPLPYTITVTNYGQGTAASVALTDQLPAGVVYGSHTASQGTCGYVSGVLSCNLGDIAQDTTVTVTLNTTAPGTPGTVVNTAAVTTSSADPNLTNNQTDISVRVSDTYYTLTVLKEGTGDGTVSGGGVNCGAACAPPVFEQTRVTLAAAPDGQSAFYGWNGAGCSGTGVLRGPDGRQ